MTFLAITFDGNDKIFEEFDTLAEAEKFAREVASEGFKCMVVQEVSTYEAEEEPFQNLEDFYGVQAGVDFPASL